MGILCGNGFADIPGRRTASSVAFLGHAGAVSHKTGSLSKIFLICRQEASFPPCDLASLRLCVEIEFNAKAQRREDAEVKMNQKNL